MFLFTSRGPAEAQSAPSRPAVPFAEPLSRAAQATGVSFDYLARTAERESRFNPTAKASTSSATGMFQFLDQTWLGMVKQEGQKLGLGPEAAAISGEAGRFSVADPALRQKIMSLREDPQVSAMMAGAFAARNGQQLQQSLGRKPSDGELYMAHFLGASGARDLIQLAAANPEAKAAGSFREAAAANRSVFFDRSGRARSAQEVYASLAASFGQGATQPGAATPLSQSVEPRTAATSDAAHAMFRVKGDGGKPLHGLFRSNGAPEASAVSEAWARMGRRAPVAEPGTARVAFFPRDGVGVRTATDAAAPTVTLTAPGRGSLTVTLPPERPQVVQATPESQHRRKAVAARQGQPFDLLQFTRPGQR